MAALARLSESLEMPGQTWQLFAFPPVSFPTCVQSGGVTNVTATPWVHPATLRIFHIDRLLLTMRRDVMCMMLDRIPPNGILVPIGEEGYG